MPSTKPPLHVHVLFHPRSELARTLAEHLVHDWMAPPGVQGLRIPVFLAPDDGSGLPPAALPLDDAEHSLAVVLADRYMARRVGGQGEQWARSVSALVEQYPPGATHHVMPVALDGKAFGLGDAIAKRHFLPLDRIEDLDERRWRLGFALCTRALHLLRDGVPADAARAGRAPVTVFVSHAKYDLDEDRDDPVRLTRSAVDELPVHDWFDAREIPEGARFEEEIRAGLQRSDAMLLFLTDSWSSRPVCRWEALTAKELQTPAVVVDALDEGEIRSFPYGGNMRSLRWRLPLRPPAEAEARERWRAEARIEGQRMIMATVREALRSIHARRRLEGLAAEDDVVLDAAPETAKLAWSSVDATFLYPDPPLSSEELDLLRRTRPRASFETPMTRFARRRADEPSVRVAISASESPDLAARGLLPHHERLLFDEVHLYLLLAGLRIVYGGKLEPEKLRDPDNFTLRLFSLARSHRSLAIDAGADPLQSIVNAAPWPLWTLYDDDVYDVFGTIAELQQIERPEIGKTDAELGALPSGFVPPKKPLQLYAWARALTHMRERVTNESAARLCVGGRIEGYKGRLAGLLEEPLVSLRAGKPLFLVGALGGCTGLVIDLLEQRERAEMSTAVARENVAHYDELAALYDELGGEWSTREEIADELRAFGASGPAACLRNGLDDAENRELYRTTDPILIAELVLRGLERLGL